MTTDILAGAQAAVTFDGTVAFISIGVTLAALIKWIREGTFHPSWHDIAGVLIATYGATFFVDAFIAESAGYGAKVFAGLAAGSIIVYRAGIWQTVVKAANDGDKVMLTGAGIALLLINFFVLSETAINIAANKGRAIQSEVTLNADVQSINEQIALTQSGVAAAASIAATACKGSRCLMNTSNASETASKRIAELRLEKGAIEAKATAQGTPEDRVVADLLGVTPQRAASIRGLVIALLLDVLAQLIHWIGAREALNKAGSFKIIKGFSSLIHAGYSPEDAAILIGQSSLAGLPPPPPQDGGVVNQKIKACEDCSTEILNPSPAQKYCPKCQVKRRELKNGKHGVTV